MRPLPIHPTHTLRDDSSSASGLREAVSDSTELPVDDPSRYLVSGEVAAGGLGRVLEATDVRLGRRVALKELLRRSEAGEARFVREALITAKLQHPGIVPVHEAGRWPTGEPYYVMKLVSGQSLKELILEQSSLEGRLALLPHVIAIAETIAYAHSKGVLHRDIKPSNVVVGDYGETVVVDWGIAKELRDPSEREGPASIALASDKETLGVLGTPAFMAPEQAKGEAVDERADIYALGAVLYNVLSGRPPYEGDNSDELVRQVLRGPPEKLESVEPMLPRDLVAIAAKAMARDRMDRYATARHLLADLKRFQTGQLVGAYHYTRLTRVRRWLARYRAVALVLVSAATLLLTGGILSLNRVLDARVVAEKERAEAQAAEETTEAQRVELIFLQAKASLERDPTAALAWLKLYPEGGPEYGKLDALAEEARSRGVARHVLLHQDWVFDVAFSPDGRSLATASQDGRVRLFDVATGAGRLLGTHGSSAQSLAFSRRGRWLATGDQRGGIRVWDLEHHEERALQGHANLVDLLLFSKEDDVLFSAGADRAVRAWDPETGSQLNIVEDDRAVMGAFAQDGSAIVLAMGSGEIDLIDPRSGWRRHLGKFAGLKRAALSPDARQASIIDDQGRVWLQRQGEARAQELGTHRGKIEWLAFSPSGRWLVSAGEDRAVYVWDVTAGLHRVLRGHEDSVYHVVFSEDEKLLVSASDDATARLWQLDTGVSHVLRGHKDDVYRVAISKDARYVATASLDRSARIWETSFDDSQSLVAEPCAEGCSVLVSTSGRDVVSFGAGRQLWVHEPASGHGRMVLPVPAEAPKEARVAVSSEGNRAALARGERGATELYDLATSQAQRLGDHGSRVTGLALSPDGRVLVSGSKDGKIRRFDTVTRESTLLSAGVRPLELALSPGRGEIAVATGQDLRLLDLATGAIKYQASFEQLGRDPFEPLALTLSTDGLTVAVRGDKRFAVWDIKTGQLDPHEAGGHNLIDLAVSPDGEFVAAAVANRTVVVASRSTGEQDILRGHTDLVLQVRFSPDGKTLASSSYDKTIRLWERGTPEARVLRGHTGSVDGIAFSHDGRRLFSASRDGTLRAWNIEQSTAAPESLRSRLNRTSAVVTEAGGIASP